MLRLDGWNACLVQSSTSSAKRLKQLIKLTEYLNIPWTSPVCPEKLVVRSCPTTQHRPEAVPPPMPTVLIVLPDPLHLFPIIDCHRSDTADIFSSSAGCSGISRVGASFHRRLSKQICVRAIEWHSGAVGKRRYSDWRLSTIPAHTRG